MTKVIDFKTAVKEKDLESFAKALFEQVTKLQIQNRELQEKIDHLEELLKNVPNVVEINSHKK